MTDPTRLRWRDNPLFILASILVLVILLFVGAFGFIAWRSYEAQQRQNETSRQTHEIVQQLQAADQQRECASRSQLLGFASILDLLGDAFGTPPAPDPDRLRVVQGFHDAAQAFRSSTPTTVTRCP